MTVEGSEKGVVESDPNNPEGKGSKGAADPATKTVPLSVLEATRADLKGQNDRLLKEIDKLKAGQPNSEKPAEKTTTYTRTQLRALVNEGKITEDQMDATLEAQLKAELLASVKATTTQESRATQAAIAIGTALGAYIEAHPDLAVEGSDLRTRVQAEFDYLVSLGDDPNSKATELKAVRAALGPLTPKGRRKTPETHQETGGSDTGTREQGGADEAWSKGLSPAQRIHYQKQIDKGYYKGPTDKRLVKEVEFARARSRH